MNFPIITIELYILNNTYWVIILIRYIPNNVRKKFLGYDIFVYGFYPSYSVIFR